MQIQIWWFTKQDYIETNTYVIISLAGEGLMFVILIPTAAKRIINGGTIGGSLNS